MPKEIKSAGKKIETVVSGSLHKKFKAKVKKGNISMSQVLRDLVQKYVKG